MVLLLRKKLEYWQLMISIQESHIRHKRSNTQAHSV